MHKFLVETKKGRNGCLFLVRKSHTACSEVCSIFDRKRRISRRMLYTSVILTLLVRDERFSFYCTFSHSFPFIFGAL